MRDFDGDGHLDAALANGIGELALHAGNGDGTFAAPQIFALTGGNGSTPLGCAQPSRRSRRSPRQPPGRR